MSTGPFLYPTEGSVKTCGKVNQSCHLGDEEEAEKKANRAEAEQQQFSTISSSKHIGEHIRHWGHQTLQTHKLQETQTNQTHLLRTKHVQWWKINRISNGLIQTCVSAPNKMTMMKKHIAHNWGKGIMATARG